jgi:hypothetical protein
VCVGGGGGGGHPKSNAHTQVGEKSAVGGVVPAVSLERMLQNRIVVGVPTAVQVCVICSCV